MSKIRVRTRAPRTPTGSCAEGSRAERDDRSRESGQTLVEFSLVFPLFIVLFLAIVEFGLVFNALLTINFTTRDASLIGAEAGNASQADCVILRKVEENVGAPTSPTRITEVRIFQADKNGAQIGSKVNVYTRTGSMACTDLVGKKFTLPYQLIGTEGYKAADRCTILAGCPTIPGSTGVDTIGVRVAYHYDWATPVGALLRFGIVDYTMVSSNVMRMEPVL